MKAAGSIPAWCAAALLIVLTGWAWLASPLLQPGEVWLIEADNQQQYPLLSIWMTVFGSTPSVTRWLSTLALLLALALLWRGMLDQREGTEAGWGLLLLALTAFWLQNSFQATGYAIGLVSAAGLWLGASRGLRRSCLVLYGGSALLAASMFPWVLLLLAGQVVVRLVQRQWRPALMMAGIGGAAGLMAVGWWTPMTAASIPWWSIVTQSGVAVLPLQMIGLLLLIGLAAGALTLTALPSTGRDGLLAWGIALLLTHLFVVPDAQFMVWLLVLPFAALLAGKALQEMVWAGRLMVLLVMGLLLVMTPRQALPYRSLVEIVTPDAGEATGIIISAPEPWQHTLVGHYLPFAEADQFHLLAPESNDPPAQSASVEADLTRLESWAGPYEQLWLVKDGGVVLEEAALAWLRQGYVATAALTWEGVPPLPDERRRVTRYLRIPSDLSDLFRFGDTFQLAAWRYRGDVRVQPCQTVRLESWWRLLQPAERNYTLTLVLADGQGQGIVRNDSSAGGIDTLLWRQDQLYVDLRALTLPCDLPTGEYPLLLGLYATAEGQVQSLPATTTEGAPLGNLVYLTTLFLEAP